MTAEQKSRQCPRCGSAKLSRLISRFSVAKSEEDRLDNLADPSSLDDPEDPRAMAQWMRKVGREMGEDLGDDFDELVEEAIREEETGGSAEDSPLGGGSDLDE